MVVLVHDPGDHEIETEARIRSQRYPGSFLLHVIDSSADVSAPANERLRTAADRWQSIPPASFGHGRTRNLALDACTTPVIVFLSQDAHPADDQWLSQLVRPLAEGRAVASYGRQLADDDAERAATFAFLYPEQPEVKTKADMRRLGLRTFHFSDVTSAFKVDVLAGVRFPEELSTFEDIGVAKRLLDEGHAIAYVAQAAVLHAHPFGWKNMVDRYRQIGAIYERLGIFDDLAATRGRSLFAEGLRVSVALRPKLGRGLGMTARVAAVTSLKAGAVMWGRWQARHESAGRADRLVGASSSAATGPIISGVAHPPGGEDGARGMAG